MKTPKFAVGMVALAWLASACSGSTIPQIENASDCDDLGAAALAEVQGILDGLADVPLSGLQGGLDPTTTDPPLLKELDASFDELGRRADAQAARIDCPDLAANGYYNSHLDELTAEGPVAEFVLSAITAGS